MKDLEAQDVKDGLTVYARAGGASEYLYGALSRNGQAEELGELGPRIARSDTGAVAFWSQGSKLVILPPFPVEQDQVLAGWEASQLRALLAKQYVLGVVLLRLGRFAVGVFCGEELVASKTDTRYVKGRHSAGGQSQKRFERIREKQIQGIFDKTCSVVREKFGPFEGQLDYIFLGGERFTLKGFLKRCEYLQKLSPKILGRVLNVREPKRKALDSVVDIIWESQVLRVQ